jgi:hypothetical protein
MGRLDRLEDLIAPIDARDENDRHEAQADRQQHHGKQPDHYQRAGIGGLGG